ncbi:hypothetical protein Tco_1265344 [Tanacetum coccineum]
MAVVNDGQRWQSTVDHCRTTARPPPKQCSGRVAGGYMAADVATDVDNQAWEGLKRLTSRFKMVQKVQIRKVQDGKANTVGLHTSDNLTMEQYLALTRGNQTPGAVKPEIGGNVNFEIKSQFMRELREETFSENKNDDAHEHVERVLDIVSLFNIPGVSHDAVMLRVFPITLTEALKRWADILSPGTIDSWTSLKKPLSKGTVHHPKPLSSLKKFVTSSRKTMADHSQKWHDGSSSRNIDSCSNSEGIAAIVSKLDSLGRDMKKLKENVHTIHVGCQTCGGAYLDKECPQNEEVKYGEFGRSSPFSNGAKYYIGPSGYYTHIDNRSPFGKKRTSLEELISKHLEVSIRRRAEMEE